MTGILDIDHRVSLYTGSVCKTLCLKRIGAL